MRTTWDLSSVSTTAAAAITVENKMTEKGKTDFFLQTSRDWNWRFRGKIEFGVIFSSQAWADR